MDSPNASGYVPLSLVDTLTRPNRSYRSHHAGTHSVSTSSTPAAAAAAVGGTLTSSRSIHHAHSASLAALASKERSEQARRDAAAIGETLGLSSVPAPETPAARRTGAYDVEATPRPGAAVAASEVAALRRHLDDREREITALKREVAALNKDKKELQLEREQHHVATVHRGGLDAVQVEELVKQFNDQEALLGGYQREAEKSLAELDRLRNKERRLNDWFERMYGPGWAEELNLTDKPALAGSPAFRGGGGPKHPSSRPNLLTTPSSSSSLSSAASSLSGSTALKPPLAGSPCDDRDGNSSTATSSANETQPPPVPPVTTSSRPTDPSLSPLALRQHLESVQALIRGMETRLIARGVELDHVEKRARNEARRAEAGRVDLEHLIASSSSFSPSESSAPASSSASRVVVPS
ncbi:hypothetical protein JCM11491_004820 [Sporobolomyces phaffii]